MVLARAIEDTGLSSSIVVQEHKKSLIDSTAGQPQDGVIDRKAMWGVFCVYMAIGAVGDFFVTFLAAPTLCQYVFGPMGTAAGDHTTLGQCNVAPSVFQYHGISKYFSVSF